MRSVQFSARKTATSDTPISPPPIPGAFEMYVINPKTRRKIKIYGPTFLKIAHTVRFSDDDEMLLRKLGYVRPGIVPAKPKPDLAPATSKTLFSDDAKTVHHLVKQNTIIKPVNVDFADPTARKMHAERVLHFIAKVPKCLTVHGSVVKLGTKLTFPKRIGTESVYGIAYVTTAQGTHAPAAFRVAAKIMDDSEANQREVGILAQTGQRVLSGAMPHFPVMFKALRCSRPACSGPQCHKLLQHTYITVLNELASGDLKTWVQTPQRVDAYQSAISQITIALCAFHEMGYAHNDAHWGNFLYHEVQPGGYWRYNICGRDMYVKNTGQLWVLWDFGLAIRLEGPSLPLEVADHARILSAFIPERWGANMPPEIAEAARSLSASYVAAPPCGAWRYMKKIPWLCRTLAEGAKVLNAQPYVIGKPLHVHFAAKCDHG